MTVSLPALPERATPLDPAVTWDQVIQPRTRELLVELMARDRVRCPVMVVVYARISRDKGMDHRGVARQVDKAVERIAQEPTWCLAAPPFVDNDVSASKELPRPEYDRLMSAVPRLGVRVIVVYMTGRMWRNRRQRAEAMEHLAGHGVRIVATGGQDLDLSTSSGRVIAGVLGELDTYETEQMAERLREEAYQRARNGLPSGVRQYGYDRTMKIIDEEADIIRACVERLLDPRRDSSLRQLILDLRESGVPNPSGGIGWRANSLRGILTNPTIAGQRTYKGEIIAPGQWEPIISQATRARLLARLTPIARPEGWSTRTKHLLSGIATCGKCGMPLVARAGRTHCKDPYAYVCPPKERGGCRGVTRAMGPVDTYVETIVVDLLSTPAILAEMIGEGMTDPTAAAKIATEIEAHQAAAAALGIEMAADDPTDEVTRILRKAQAETIRTALAAARARQAAMVGSTVFEGLDQVTAADMAAHWKSLAVQRRRALIRAMVTVTIFPGRRGRIAFDHTLVNVERRRPPSATTHAGHRADQVPNL
jgi:DNA invertase Pin-like site-specific DNA recombinase